MDEKELFKKTEGRLYRYFKGIKERNSLIIEIEGLNRQKKIIAEDIQNTNIELEADLNMGISYGEKVQTSATGTSYAEQQSIAHINKLQRELNYINKKLFKKKAKIREIERNSIALKYNIDTLSEDDKQFLEWKYGENKSVDWIATEMFGGARTTAYRRREELVKNVANWNRLV